MKIIKVIGFTLLFISLNSYAVETVRVVNSILIKAPIDKVCEFVTNPLNDHLWRAEVNSMDATRDEVAVGVIYTEDAWIGIQKNFTTVTELVALSCPHYGTFITVKENPYFLKSHREFKSIKEGLTKFTYKVDFDKKMIKKTFGLEVKEGAVIKLYSILMKLYLKKLSKILE